MSFLAAASLFAIQATVAAPASRKTGNEGTSSKRSPRKPNPPLRATSIKPNANNTFAT